MKHSTGQSPLTAVQQNVVTALAAGATLTDAAAQYGLNRVTVYRWLKTRREFTDAVRQARADFVLARRDDLFRLSSCALETLYAVLKNPKASPAVQLKAAIFILTRPELPKTGWSIPEPSPNPDGIKLTDSAIIEQDYDSLPGIVGLERYGPVEPEAPAAETADVSECNGMQRDPQNSEDVAPARRPAGTATRSNELRNGEDPAIANQSERDPRRTQDRRRSPF
jgi:hypothetical protein